ncbi:hypothetical protein DFH08DRAFT_808905 [Mycena albidolilacea]|uniref:Uncharacterized protein n=1 Tax=Mycena albidolilacea TaxID=1033008 RepID=A0AAD7ESV0_9AGAR|nr:hypothetical protein DFH08DRAFT_808905 [Mycena albidolilacea]
MSPRSNLGESEGVRSNAAPLTGWSLLYHHLLSENSGILEALNVETAAGYQTLALGGHSLQTVVKSSDKGWIEKTAASEDGVGRSSPWADDVELKQPSFVVGASADSRKAYGVVFTRQLNNNQILADWACRGVLIVHTTIRSPYAQHFVCQGKTERRNLGLPLTTNCKTLEPFRKFLLSPTCQSIAFYSPAVGRGQAMSSGACEEFWKGL